MQNSKRTWVAKILVFCLCFSIGLGCFGNGSKAFADPLTEYQKEQARIQQEMAAKKAELRAKDKSLKSLQSQLKDVEYDISQSEAELGSLTKQLSVAQRELEVTNKELKKTQAQLTVQLSAFENRLRESYMNGEVTIVDVLFDSTSMEDFITRSYYMERMLQYDTDMMNVINDRIDDINTKKAAVQKKTNNLSQLKQIQQNALATLASSRSAKSDLVSKAEDDKELSAQAYEELEKSSNEVAAQIRRIQAASAASGNGGQGTGIYRWPLPSNKTNITSPYAMRRHPTTGVYKMHTGIDISAPNGTPIYAADDGLVIIAQNSGAYGIHVIIDHGGNIATLYGHMSRIGASVGQTVKRGDVIGYVGSTGWSTGNHLHFEVRKNGSHVSPWNYVSKP